MKTMTSADLADYLGRLYYRSPLQNKEEFEEALRCIQRLASRKKICILFDGPPSHESGRFVEVEDENGNSIRAGEWVDCPQGYAKLMLEVPTFVERI